MIFLSMLGIDDKKPEDSSQSSPTTTIQLHIRFATGQTWDIDIEPCTSLASLKQHVLFSSIDLSISL
jgi:hypothetical protein